MTVVVPFKVQYQVYNLRDGSWNVCVHAHGHVYIYTSSCAYMWYGPHAPHAVVTFDESTYQVQEVPRGATSISS